MRELRHCAAGSLESPASIGYILRLTRSHYSVQRWPSSRRNLRRLHETSKQATSTMITSRIICIPPDQSSSTMYVLHTKSTSQKLECITSTPPGSRTARARESHDSPMTSPVRPSPSSPMNLDAL
ncbi:hypothetical protein OH77DRAFT_1416985 [Trametes cingulata]|nr:hypothetical protein OH77DRAFT_1416985 [Trametes cingulata]